MEKEIRYRVHLQHEDTGTITSKDFNYTEIFSGSAMEWRTVIGNKFDNSELWERLS